MECLHMEWKALNLIRILLVPNGIELGPDGIFILNNYGRVKKGGDVPLFYRFYHYCLHLPPYQHDGFIGYTLSYNGYEGWVSDIGEGVWNEATTSKDGSRRVTYPILIQRGGDKD